MAGQCSIPSSRGSPSPADTGPGSGAPPVDAVALDVDVVPAAPIDALASIDEAAASAPVVGDVASIDVIARLGDGAANADAPADASLPPDASLAHAAAVDLRSAAAAAVDAAMAFDEPTDRIAARRRAEGSSSSTPDNVFSPLARARAAVAPLIAFVTRGSASRLRPTVPSTLASLVSNPRRRVVAFAAAVAIVLVTRVVVGGGGAEPEDDLARQARLIDETRAFAADGEHAWAFAQCSDALEVDPTTRLGKEAAILCAEEGALLGERDHVTELERLANSLAPDDPMRADAVRALERLDAFVACDACANADTRRRIKDGAATPTPNKSKSNKRPRPRRPR